MLFRHRTSRSTVRHTSGSKGSAPGAKAHQRDLFDFILAGFTAICMHFSLDFLSRGFRVFEDPQLVNADRRNVTEPLRRALQLFGGQGGGTSPRSSRDLGDGISRAASARRDSRIGRCKSRYSDSDRRMPVDYDHRILRGAEMRLTRRVATVSSSRLPT
jgi:hypothetical protein